MKQKKYFLLLFVLVIVVTGGAARTVSPCPMVPVVAERLPDLTIPRSGHSVFYVNHELTVAGGHTNGFVLTPTAEYFKGGAWHMLPMIYSHDNGGAIVMQSGKVLLAGGHEKNLGIGQSYEVETYDPLTHSFQGFACLDRKRALAQGVEIAGGQVVIAGNHQGPDDQVRQTRCYQHRACGTMARLACQGVRTADKHGIASCRY